MEVEAETEEGGDVSAEPSVAGGGVGDDKQPHYSHLNVSG